MIKIGIVEDKSNNRRIIKDKLARNPSFQLVMESTNGEEFLETIQKMNTDERPHIVLMDLEMPVVDGVTAIATASSLYPDIKFVVLTIFDDDNKIFSAIRSGSLWLSLERRKRSGN
ncbi:MAG: response regulator transcription factor [Chitinophagaceae bacterium]|nr:response regulator transcription factor [Chitinophagaceae bacterium]